MQHTHAANARSHGTAVSAYQYATDVFSSAVSSQAAAPPPPMQPPAPPCSPMPPSRMLTYADVC